MQLDLILYTLLALLTIIGFFRGFIAEFFSIFGIILAILLAKSVTPEIITLFKVSQNTKLNLIIYIATVVVLYLILAIIVKFLKMVVKIAFLGWLDKLLGALIGLIKGTLIVIVTLIVIMACSPVSTSCEKLIEKSNLAAVILPNLNVFGYFFPTDVKRDITQFKNQQILDKVLQRVEASYKNLKNEISSKGE